MTQARRRRVAYCTVPKIGGTFNFYVNLRKSMARHGWEVLAPAVGKDMVDLWDDGYADAGCVRVAADSTDPKESARRFVEWCLEESIDIVLPMSMACVVSAIPHFPTSLRTIYRCSNITRHAYDIVTAHLESVDAVVATSRRQYDDLLHRRHVPQEKLKLIPHGIDVPSFSSAGRNRVPDARLRLIFLGRLLDSAKGIFLLPRVLRHLRGRAIDAKLIVVGDGPDRARLEAQFRRSGVASMVEMQGNLPHGRIAEKLGQADVLLMPSRFEGFGFSLIEAMAAGVVPIVTRVSGVTDWIVEDGMTGFVIEQGNARLMADRIEELNSDRVRLARLSSAASEAAVKRFDKEEMGRAYGELFEETLAKPGPEVSPRDWSQFQPCPAFRPTWAQWIPSGLKERLRAWIERWR